MKPRRERRRDQFHRAVRAAENTTSELARLYSYKNFRQEVQEAIGELLTRARAISDDLRKQIGNI